MAIPSWSWSSSSTSFAATTWNAIAISSAKADFALFLDHGAYFTNCNYDYANTRTAPGHATLFTGAYSNGHGIVANEWWDSKKKKMVTVRRRR